MTAWASLVLTALKIVSSLITWARERNLLRQGEERAFARALKEQADACKRADDARDAQRRRNAAADSAGSLPDDGFRRD